MSERVKRTAETYNRIAGDYARKKEYEYSLPELAKFSLLLPPGSHVVSAGCGAGRDIAEFQKDGFSVAGADVSEGLLRVGRKQHPDLDLILADMRSMPFANESFQGVWAHESIHHLEKQDIVPTLQEFERILAPNGFLFILTRKGIGDVVIREDMSARQAREYTLLEPYELHSMLTQTGFELIELYTFNEQERKENGRDLNWISAFYSKTAV